MQSSIWEEIKNFFVKGSVLSRLIGINVVIFVIAGIVRVIFFLSNASPAYEGIIHWFGVSSNPETILGRPWTLVTYMFLHLDFFHIFFNMLMLYIGGRIFRDFLGEERMTGTYLIGGLMGALFFIVSYNIFPVFGSVKGIAAAIGASASVLAIFVAIATYRPNFELPLILIGRIRLKYIALFFVVIDLISIDQGNPGGHLAHLGGALWGFLYISILKTGKDPAKFLGKWVSAITAIFKPRPRMRVRYNSQRPVSDEEYNRQRAENQKKLDKILDKISQHGYQSLTTEEKDLLFKMSDKE